MKRLVPYLSLLTSFSTLLCCAIPALLVALGMGATLAATVTSFPQLIWISQHKNALFVFAGAMLTIAFYIRHVATDIACPLDPELAAACKRTKRYSISIFYFSCTLYCIGGFFAFVAPLFL